MNNQLGFVLDGASIKLKYAHIKAVTDLHYASPVAVRYDLKQRWLAYVDGISERREKPTTCASIAVVSYTFLLVQINADARGIAWTSVGGSTALAFAVLLIFTLNWRIAALATLTIGCIVSQSSVSSTSTGGRWTRSRPCASRSLSDSGRLHCPPGHRV